MTINPLYVNETLPADDLAAMREFDDRYLASIGAGLPPSWADAGDLFPTEAPLLTFPISSIALKYQRTTGESRFKTLLAKSFDLKTEEFDVGVEAPWLAVKTQQFAYRLWLEGPARMMLAEARHRNKAIVSLLSAGESTLWGASFNNPLGIDTKNFFSATHRADFNDAASTAWSNYQVSAKSPADMDDLKEEVTAFQGVLDENGDKIGADPDMILVPTALYEPTKFKLAQNLILENGTGSAGVSNPYTTKFTLVHVPELTSDVDWYLVDSKLRASSGLPPWLSARYTPPDPALTMREWDTSTDYFKDTGNIKKSSHIWHGHCLGFPHAIRKIKGS